MVETREATPEEVKILEEKALRMNKLSPEEAARIKEAFFLDEDEAKRYRDLMNEPLTETEEKIVDECIEKIRQETKVNQVLEQAKSLVNGDRADAYGSARTSFGSIAMLWKNYLASKFEVIPNLQGVDVAMMMILLKTSRIATGGFQLDSLVDIAGYAALANALHEPCVTEEPVHCGTFSHLQTKER